jgi:hypothetical protein
MENIWEEKLPRYNTSHSAFISAELVCEILETNRLFHASHRLSNWYFTVHLYVAELCLFHTHFIINVIINVLTTHLSSTNNNIAPNQDICCSVELKHIYFVH